MTTTKDVSKAWTEAAYEVRMWLCEILVGWILIVIPMKHKDGPLLNAGIDYYFDLLIDRDAHEVDDCPLSPPLNDASVRVINSIINTRFDESEFIRDYDED